MKKKLFVFLLLCCFCAAQAASKPRIERVEPLSWWVGLETPLQLMFYGDNLRGAKVSCLQEGMTVAAMHEADSPNYLFVDVQVAPGARPGVYDFEFVRGKERWKQPYTLAARREGSAMRPSFTPADAVYLLMPDRFADGDASNNTVEGYPDKADRTDRNGRHGGDIQGMIDRLDYISGLGATALWSTPLLLDNEPRVSYHGYACADYYLIDPRYGTNELYRKMVAEAHDRGLKVIMDIVTNHCGTSHWWMSDLPFADWINRFDRFTRTNNAMLSPADPHASASDRDLFLRGWFDVSMPDMNLDNPFVLQYFKQWAVWWMEWAGLDGLRVDTHPYNSPGPMSQWVAALRREYPKINIVGECWYPTPAMLTYWEGAKTNADGFNSGLPSVMDFPLQMAVTQGLAKDNPGWGEGIRKVYDILAQDYIYAAPGTMMIMAGNHDTDRLFHTLGQNPRKVMLAYTLLATLRGVPQIYAGDELLFLGNHAGGDGGKRIDFPGGWKGDSVDLFTGAGRNADQRMVFDHISRILNWRKGASAIHDGRMLHYLPVNDVYVYFRWNDRQRVMVIVNASAKEQVVDWGRFAEGLAGCTSGEEIVSGRKLKVGEEITLLPLTSMIVELAQNPAKDI